MNDFLIITANTQIATALVLIAALLLYIAYKLSEGKKRKSKSSYSK